MRLTLAQLNPVVGHLSANARLLIEALEQARDDGAEIVVGAEMGLLGYPPRDLLFRKGVVEACEQAVEDIARRFPDLVVIVGHPRRASGGLRPFHNSASICTGGHVTAVYDKRLLPGYDIFDEDRYYEPGTRPCVVEVGGRRVAVMICEDLWQAGDVTAYSRYRSDPLAETAAAGCDLLVVLNASPFVLGKWRRHVQQLRAAATRYCLPIVAVNAVGANDDLIFDGRSLVVDAAGSPLAVLPGWQPSTETIDVPLGAATAPTGLPADVALEVDPLSELFNALVLGVRDYVGKTGHRKVSLGLSGGIDSTLTACIAAAALGPENVHGVMMPSRYSSAMSVEDASELADRLGLARCDTVPIESVHSAMHEVLDATLGDAGGVTDENIQCRVRGMLLMAHSNATGSLVLVPSNKSEMATGYSTIYGDLCGALAVLGDVVKTRVYALSEWINANAAACGFDGPPIPDRCLTKPPSAELRPNQTDQDTLPPYELLDKIVVGYIEREQSIRQIVEETDLPPDLVESITRMIDRAQYKRDQTAPVLKVTQRTFGRGRPMPIAMFWQEGAKAVPAEAGTKSDRR